MSSVAASRYEFQTGSSCVTPTEPGVAVRRCGDHEWRVLGETIADVACEVLNDGPKVSRSFCDYMVLKRLRKDVRVAPPSDVRQRRVVRRIGDGHLLNLVLAGQRVGHARASVPPLVLPALFGPTMTRKSTFVSGQQRVTLYHPSTICGGTVLANGQAWHSVSRLRATSVPVTRHPDLLQGPVATDHSSVVSRSVASALLEWIRSVTVGWKPSIVGVFRENADHEWPLTAQSSAQLREALTNAGHLLPLPSEPAALANVMEIELRRHLCEAAATVANAEIAEGTERSFPDLEFSGDAFGGGHRAVDIKCARVKQLKNGTPSTNLNNRIALCTGNTYFLWPDPSSRASCAHSRTTPSRSLSLCSTASTRRSQNGSPTSRLSRTRRGGSALRREHRPHASTSVRCRSSKTS